MSTGTLRARLAYEPVELRFGTSGRRGRIVDLTHLEIYLNARAELEYLKSLPAAEGGIAAGHELYFAADLRPSSPHISQAIVQAILDAGLVPVNLGLIPTPALAAHALARSRASIMVTGSHIPFDRNGYKLNTARGELMKHHEAPINARVAELRETLYSQPFDASPFNEHGLLTNPPELPAPTNAARDAYQARYTNYFEGLSLKGLRLLVYQHSAVGRDLLCETLTALGAEALPVGRSETFVPIDTENIDAATLAVIQQLADEHGPADAVVSTDGDSDRPLLLAIDPGTQQARFFGGDLVGMIVAQSLEADAVVVPISCNDAIDRGPLSPALEPKTRIGSPFVIAGMEAALEKGRRRVCGWEANGGFLTGSDFQRGPHTLAALPTRDAFLPLLAVLFEAQRRAVPITALFDELPRRFSRAALLKNFPRPTALAIVDRFTPQASDGSDQPGIYADLASFFPAFGPIDRVDYTDGVRVIFANGDVAHIRPSGNADELRIYAVSDTQARADEIAALGVAEPAGILRRMEATTNA
jgi:phosphomannomutase